MARILIFVTNTTADPGGDMVISGQATVEGDDAPIGFEARPVWGSTVSQINQAIEDAAVAAAVADGHTIGSGTNDRITLAAAKAL